MNKKNVLNIDIVVKIIKNRFFGTEITINRNYQKIVEYINHRTPTAYGTVIYRDQEYQECNLITVEDHLKDTILLLISKMQSADNSNVISVCKIEDFIKTGEKLVKILHGGSASQILLLKNIDSERFFVRKIASRMGVEGNGTPKLHAEVNFLLEIYKHDNYKKLRELYPHMINHTFTEKFTTLDLEYIGEGKNVLTQLSKQEVQMDDHIEYFNNLLSVLIPHGYALRLRQVSKRESLEHLEDYYLRRAEGRIFTLHNNDCFKLDFPCKVLTKLSELVCRKNFCINGVWYRHPVDIISEIRNNTLVSNILAPKTEGFCAHGDSTFLNIIFDPLTRSYKLIDNRGYFGNWDTLYDFGKLKFTLSGFGQIMLNEFDLSEDATGAFSLTMIGNNHSVNILRELNKSFFDHLLQNKAFNLLIKNEPHWRNRILFAEAIHYLSDIPHRLLLDRSPKNAVAVFLLGTVFLNDVRNSIQV
jgi:hypothetical protein